MIKNFLKQVKESFFSVAPISLAIFLICFLLVPTSTLDKVNLLFCFGLLVLGLAFFQSGANVSMTTIGESVGSGLCRTKKLWLIVLTSFTIGFVITFAEPDLQVFASEVASSFSGISSKWIVAGVISLGVAISLLLAVFTFIFKLSYKVLMFVSYTIVIVLSFFVDKTLIGFAFDSGSVTTGPISVPFIISFGLGISTVLWRKKKEDDAFGTIGLCSVGPIIACIILAIFVKGGTVTSLSSTQSLSYLGFFLKFLKEVAIVILPILIIFLLFQKTMIKYPRRFVLKIILGLIVTYLGIVVFLVGVNFGYLPLGRKIGSYVANYNKFLLIPIAFVFGFCAVIAEPALAILKSQIFHITKGKISKNLVTIFIALGVSLATTISCLTIVFGLNIHFILIIATVLSIVLSLFNSTLFSAIAFDSGGVATGALSVSFILPFVNSASAVIGAVSGFGTVALIAIFPVLSMQILGIVVKIKSSKGNKTISASKQKQQIVEFDWEEE